MTKDYSPSEYVSTQSTFPAAIHAWEIFLADNGRSVYTIKAFRGDIQLLSSFFSPDRSIGSIAMQDIQNFLSWMENERKAPCSPKTYSRRITAIKAFFKWLHAYNIIVADPSEKIVQKTVISPLPQVLSIEECGAVLSAANEYRSEKRADARPMVLIQLLLSTGIKKGEVVSLMMNHIELDHPENPRLHIRYAKPEQRYKERVIDLAHDWVAVYQEYIVQYEITNQIFPWSARRLEYLLEDIGKRAGLTKHLSFDMCRWTCALHDMYTKETPEKIREKLGVSKIQWREISLKLSKLLEQYTDSSD